MLHISRKIALRTTVTLFSNSNKIEGKTVQASVETVEDSGIGAGDLLSSKFNDSFINCISLEEEREARQEIDSFMSNVAKAEGDSGFAVGSDTNSSKEFRIKQKGRVKTLCSPWTVFDEIPAAMYGLSDLNEVALGNLMIDRFNRLYSADMFYPVLEPLLGTWSCRFCGKKFNAGNSNDRPVRHSRKCAKQALINDGDKILDQEFPILKCTWVSRSGCQCKKEDFKSSTEAAQHLDNHLCKDIEVPGVRCCRLAPCNKRIDAVDFDSLTA